MAESVIDEPTYRGKESNAMNRAPKSGGIDRLRKGSIAANLKDMIYTATASLRKKRMRQNIGYSNEAEL